MSFLSKGKEAESKFAKLFKNVTSSTNEQDIKDHYDLEVATKFDVKGLKKRLRSDDAPDETIHWVELVNVNGDKGWVHGEADYFVFETEDYWIIVSKAKLIALVEEKTINEYTIIPIPYRLYSRKDRKDKLTLVKTIDLMYISESMISKKLIKKC